MTEVEDLAAISMRRTRDGVASEGLTAALARLYGQHVRLDAGRAQLSTWSDTEFGARFAEVIELIDAAGDGREAGDDWRAAYKRAGEILEWLAHPGLNRARLPLSLMGAACYQLAGYPARASTLVRDADELEPNAPLLEMLLAGDFPRLLVEGAEAANSVRRGVVGEENAAPVSWYGHVAGSVAGALAILASDFRWGDQRRRTRAIEKLSLASDALRASEDPFAWLLVRLTVDVARDMLSTSLRPYLSELSSDLSATGKAAFEGYGRQRFRDRRLLAWPSQKRGLDRLTLGRSFALCTPTGSGKTTVAEVALLRGLFQPRGMWDLAPLCLYIVPTRALAAEVENKLSRALRFAGLRQAVRVTGLYGGTDWGPSDAWLSADEQTVLICTQEKAEALIRYFGGAVTRRLRLVVVDEAHEISEFSSQAALESGESRALRLESLVSRLRALLNDDECQFIAMSAVAENLDAPLARWMVGQADAQPVVSTYRSTRQVVGRLVCRGGRTRIVHDALDGAPLRVLDRTDPAAFVPNPFPVHPRVPENFHGAVKDLAPYALWAGVNLAATGQAVLVSVTTGIRNWANWFEMLLGEWGNQTPDFFQAPADDSGQSLYEAAREATADYFGADSRERLLLDRGVIVHYGRMPGRLPRLLVQLVERRVVNLVIATSGLSQGVNLPFETVILPMIRRHDGPMGRREFWNLAGRAGRPGVATEGRLLAVDNEDAGAWHRTQFQTHFAHLLRGPGGASSTGRSPLASLMTLIRSRLQLADDDAYSEWLEVTAPLDVPVEEGDAVAALDSLDSFLIAALAEQPRGGELETEDWLKRVWQSTFAAVASAEEERLERAFLIRGKAIEARIYPSAEQRRAFYITALPPRDAIRVEAIQNALKEHLETGVEYADWGPEARLAFVSRALEVLAGHPRFAPPEHVGQSQTITWQTVVSWWLAKEIAPTSPSQAQVGVWIDFISTHFSYRFTWALSSVLAGIQAEAGGDGLPSFSSDDWLDTGLPWSALWLKDLIEWGTLEPVAAYLLARGGSRTRPEAERSAADYYAESDAEVADVLAPDEIRDWAARQRERAAPRDRAAPPETLEVRLEPNLPPLAFEQLWRVVPSVQDELILWLDPAGRSLATARGLEWSESWGEEFDFWFDPADGLVRSSRY